MSRIFEKGYSLILSEKYRVIRIISSLMFITFYPLTLLLLTDNVLLALVLPSLYGLYALLIYSCYRYLLGNGFGRSRFALSLSISTASLGSLGDILLSLIFKRLLVLISILAFTGVHLSLFEITHKNEDIGKRICKIFALFASAIPPQYIASRFIEFPLKFYLTTDFAVYAASLISIHVMVKYVEKLSSSYMLELLRSMLEAFGDKVYSFENTLLKICKRVKTYVHMLLIEREDGKRFFIVVPYLHFGPISGTEGSRLLHDLITKLEKETGIDVLYMHGVGSHELDVVGKDSSEHVLSRCVYAGRALLRGSCDSESDGLTTVPCRLCGKYVDVLKVPINSISLTIISRNINASDDIPMSVYRRVIKKLPTSDIIFIDAQNAYEGDSAWTEDEIKELSTILKRLQKRNEKRYRLYVAWRKIKREELDAPEVGPLGGYILLLKYVPLDSNLKPVTALLVVFDSNNMKRELRNRIISELSKLRGYDYVEVLTMDDHELVKFVSGKGYAVLGEYTDFDKLIDILNTKCEELERDLCKVSKVLYKRVEIAPRVFSEEGFEYVREKLSNCIRNYRKIAILIILVPLISLLLTLSVLC